MKSGLVFLMTMAVGVFANAGEINHGHFNSVTSKVELSVSYAGGCSQHFFELKAGDSCLESFPVQCTMQLIHTMDEPDYCEAFITRDIELELPSGILGDSYYERAHFTIYGDSNTSVSIQLP